MRIDLHTHSLASDGTQSPRELVTAARASGLDVVAITDHDTAAGWDEARLAAYDVGIELVRGMEVSTRYRGHGVHLLAYLPDPTQPDLMEALERIVGGRDTRVPAMLEALNRLDISITADDVRAANPGTTVVGRPHVADALVAMKVVETRDDAFERYLKVGRPAYVDRYATPLPDMIGIVARAGGVSVVAHPWARLGPDGLPERDIARLAEAGLAGLEVDHQQHDAATRDRLRGIARDLDLVATGSSDHHGAGKTDHELGCNTTDPDAYARLLGLAAAAAAASGCDVPDVVRP